MDSYMLVTLSVIAIAVVGLVMLNKDFRGWVTDPFRLEQVVKNIDTKALMLQEELYTSHKKLDSLHAAVETYELLYKDYRLHKLIVESLDGATPDMLWAKDTEGKYMLTNKRIREDLLFSDNPEGKTDIELALARKKIVGDGNHTFGEVCADSDRVVLEKEAPLRFVEWGTISGNLVVLEVHKNVIKDPFGDVLGTCGIARDITAEYKELRDIASESTCESTRSRIIKVMDKYKFVKKDEIDA